MELPRDEMAFRADYEILLSQQSLTTVFRPGNRIFPKWRGYKHGEVVTGRIIKCCGCDKENTAPVFTDLKIPLRVVQIETIPVSELSAQDFLGSSWDVTDADSLNQHIQRIYNKPLSAYGNVVTRIALDYLDPIDTAAQLRANS